MRLSDLLKGFSNKGAGTMYLLTHISEAVYFINNKVINEILGKKVIFLGLTKLHDMRIKNIIFLHIS